MPRLRYRPLRRRPDHGTPEALSEGLIHGDLRPLLRPPPRLRPCRRRCRRRPCRQHATSSVKARHLKVLLSGGDASPHDPASAVQYSDDGRPNGGGPRRLGQPQPDELPSSIGNFMAACYPTMVHIQDHLMPRNLGYATRVRSAQPWVRHDCVTEPTRLT
ncbi:hypothetical protein SANTM175S_00043 [Streptomyces antimycoticus]